jgi:hypothetical protein
MAAAALLVESYDAISIVTADGEAPRGVPAASPALSP